MRVVSRVERSMVVPAADLDVSRRSRHCRANGLRVTTTSGVKPIGELRSGRETESVRAEHGVGVHDHAVADRHMVRRRARRDGNRPCAPITTSLPMVTCGKDGGAGADLLRAPT